MSIQTFGSSLAPASLHVAKKASPSFGADVDPSGLGWGKKEWAKWDAFYLISDKRLKALKASSTVSLIADDTRDQQGYAVRVEGEGEPIGHFTKAEKAIHDALRGSFRHRLFGSLTELWEDLKKLKQGISISRDSIKYYGAKMEQMYKNINKRSKLLFENERSGKLIQYDRPKGTTK